MSSNRMPSVCEINGTDCLVADIKRPGYASVSPEKLLEVRGHLCDALKGRGIIVKTGEVEEGNVYIVDSDQVITLKEARKIHRGAYFLTLYGKSVQPSVEA